MDLAHIATKELEAELAKRQPTPICPTCNAWQAYMGCSRSWREELHCCGCRKAVALCNCRR